MYPWVYGFGPTRNDLQISKTDYDYRDNQWHMLTFISNGSSAKAYVDGQFIGSDDSVSGPGSWTAGQTHSLTLLGGTCLYAYQGCTSITEFFDGMLDNVRIYDRELSLSEIQQLKQEAVAAPPLAVADSFIVNNNQNTQLNILSNDTGEALNAVAIQITSHKPNSGTVTVSDQIVTYQPKVGYVGEDWFEYKLTNSAGNQSVVVKVTVEVKAPVAGLRQGLVAEYLFDDSTNLGLDSSGNGHNAGYSGSPTTVSGKVGQALLVDELSDVLTGIPGYMGLAHQGMTYK